jgi:flagellar secretion chaperone FliS
MRPANPWQSYRQIATQTASPGQLVLMLYEGAIRFLERARLGFAIEDPAESNETINNNVQRAQDIIHELGVSLNMSEGGEFAARMSQLYEYMHWRLMDSNIKKDEDGIRETIRRLTDLRDAWAAMMQNHCPPPGVLDSSELTPQPSLTAA